jgi:hypothetical protein
MHNQSIFLKLYLQDPISLKAKAALDLDKTALL